MNVREALAKMLTASGSPEGEVSVDASLFRAAGVRANSSFELIGAARAPTAWPEALAMTSCSGRKARTPSSAVPARSGAVRR